MLKTHAEEEWWHFYLYSLDWSYHGYANYILVLYYNQNYMCWKHIIINSYFDFSWTYINGDRSQKQRAFKKMAFKNF